MSAEFTKTTLEGVFLIQPAHHEDSRGLFLETYHKEKYSEAGINKDFVQDNFSRSKRNTLRGLHYQLKQPQAKLVHVIKGEIFDVAVDIRKDSPDFGKWVGATLSGENKKQIYVPEGFAHGFCVLSEFADVVYKCTDFYRPDDDYGVIWSDKTVGISWPVTKPILSPKDSGFKELTNILSDNLPVHSK